MFQEAIMKREVSEQVDSNFATYGWQEIIKDVWIGMQLLAQGL